MHIISALRAGFAFFVLFHIASQCIYVIGDVADRYDERKASAVENIRYCDEVCGVSGSAARRYGKYAHNCEEACRPSARWPLLAASREAIAHYHLCGIDVGCVDAFVRFGTSWSGIATLALALVFIPSILTSVVRMLSFGWIDTSRHRQQKRRVYDGAQAISQGGMSIEEIQDQTHEVYYDSSKLRLGSRAQIEQTTGDQVWSWLHSLKSGTQRYLAGDRIHAQ